jgi:hypothetical protein
MTTFGSILVAEDFAGEDVEATLIVVLIFDERGGGFKRLIEKESRDDRV